MPTNTPRIERRVQSFSAPAAGGELVISPAGQGSIQVLSIRFSLTTSAVAGQRSPVLTADDGTSIFWQGGPFGDQPPGESAAYCAYPGAPVGGGDAGGPVSVSATGAAAAAGSATLPAGADITGFVLEFQNATATIAGQVTVTGAQGGTLTYDINQVINTPTSLTVNYPGQGLPPASAAVGIAVNVPAMVGGGAWSLTVTGTVSTGSPRSVPLPREGLHLRRGYRLRTITLGLDVGDQYAAIVTYVQEFPDAPGFDVEPTMPAYGYALDE